MPNPPNELPDAGLPPSPVARARRVARARTVLSTDAPGAHGIATSDGSTTRGTPDAPAASDEPELDEPELDEPELHEPELHEPQLDEPEFESAGADGTAADEAVLVAPAVRPRPQQASRTVAGLRGRERTGTAVLDAPDAGGTNAGGAAPPPPPTSRAGRNLPAAIGVGLALGALIIGTLFAYRPSFAFVVGAAVLYGCYEVWKAFSSARIKISLLPLLVGSVAMLVAAWTRGPSGLVLAALITVLGVFVWRLGDGAQGYTRDAAASAFVVLYLPLLAGFALLLAHPSDGAGRVIVFVATVVCSDTGGYATGVLFGRHPLAPVVSKGKTWEGFAGSVLACLSAGVLFFVFTFHQEWWKGVLFGLAIVVTATLGDLGESMIKRDLEIKDMGSLLPGHGGVLDRLDSLLPCAVVAYLVLSAYATRG